MKETLDSSKRNEETPIEVKEASSNQRDKAFEGGYEEESHNEPPLFKFRDRRFWVDEDKEDDDNEVESSDKPSYVQQLENRVAEAEKKLSEYVKTYRQEVEVEWKRTKERIAREAEKSLNIERRRIVGSLVEVLDMLDMSLDSAKQKEDLEALLQGLTMVKTEFEKKLLSHGLEPVEAEGKDFDPHIHEALAVEETDDGSLDGKITSVYKKGYLLAGELVRPAMVTVARKKTD